MTREQYHHWRDTNPSGRYERIDGHIITIAPERGAHLRAKSAIWLALRTAIEAAHLPCQALPDGATIQTGDSDYEPDAVVNCGDPMADDAINPPNPIITVEVLSPSTQGTDTGAKLAGYFRLPSIQHYLIIHPTRRLVIHHRRGPDSIETALLSTGLLNLDPPGLTIDLADLY